MLTLAGLTKSHKTASRGMNEIIPTMLLATDSVLLNKNGSITAALDLFGVDLEGKLQGAYDNTASNQEHAFCAFTEHITLDQFVDRSRTYDYPSSEFEDEVSAAIDTTWRAQFTTGRQYRNRLTLFITYTPSKTKDGLVDRVMGKITREGQSWVGALTSTLKSHYSVGDEMRATSEEISGYIRTLEEQIGTYASSFTSGRIVRLTGPDLLGALYRRINLDPGVERVKVPESGVYLDSLLSANVVQLDENAANVLVLDGHQKKYAACLSVKEWPATSFPGMLDHLLTIPGEFVVHHAFRFASAAYASKYTADMASHHKDLSVKLKDMVRQAVTGREPENRDAGRLSLAADAEFARASITANNERFGWYHFSIVVTGESHEALAETLDQIRKALARYEIVSLRESMGLLSSYAGNIPGNGDLLIRWFFFRPQHLPT